MSDRPPSPGPASSRVAPTGHRHRLADDRQRWRHTHGRSLGCSAARGIQQGHVLSRKKPQACSRTGLGERLPSRRRLVVFDHVWQRASSWAKSAAVASPASASAANPSELDGCRPRPGHALIAAGFHPGDKNSMKNAARPPCWCLWFPSHHAAGPMIGASSCNEA